MGVLAVWKCELCGSVGCMGVFCACIHYSYDPHIGPCPLPLCSVINPHHACIKHGKGIMLSSVP